MYVSTWNVGNKAPTTEAASGWLKSARGSDVIAIGAQEASYVKTKKTTKPSAVSAACGDVEPFKSRFKKGFFHSSKWTRLGMMMGGAMAGGVMGYVREPCAGCSPVGTRASGWCKRSRCECIGLISYTPRSGRSTRCYRAKCCYRCDWWCS